MSIFSTRPQPARILAAILCLAGLLFSASVLAQHQAFDKGYKSSPFYFGVAYGTPDNDILPTGFEEKEDDVAWKIYAGRKFARFFGVEVGFADLGSTDASGVAGAATPDPFVFGNLFLVNTSSGATDKQCRRP